jgi:hypothetical protein
MQSFARLLKMHWEYLALVLIALVLRLTLLRVYDVELSQDGFEAVRTLTIWQTQGIAALPRDLLDRALLHPLYMLVLGALRFVTPVSLDFYFVARLLSTLFACVAVVFFLDLTQRAVGKPAAWCAALFLTFAPTFLWESIAILSSTLFLAFYIAVLLALLQSRYRLAAFLAFLSALVRYEGIVLVALTFIALVIRDVRARKFQRDDWLACVACAVAFPLTLIAGSLLATGNPAQFIGAQSMASIWLRILAPGDFWKRAAFFVTQYPALIPVPMVWLGVAGIILALIWHRARGTFLALALGALYVIFFEVLVWLDYTTLETRFLMYPGLPLIIFAGVTIQSIVNSRPSAVILQQSRTLRTAFYVLTATLVTALIALSYQQGELGLRYIYNSQASMRQMAGELAQILPANQRLNVLAYGGTSGALDLFARQSNLQLTFTEFRFAPDDNPEQYVIDNQIRFVIYPVGNAFAKAKYPYLAQFEEQTHHGVIFRPLVQFATSLDNQMYMIWSVAY